MRRVIIADNDDGVQGRALLYDTETGQFLLDEWYFEIDSEPEPISPERAGELIYELSQSPWCCLPDSLYLPGGGAYPDKALLAAYEEWLDRLRDTGQWEEPPVQLDSEY